MFARGIGIHAASGITFDLDEIRASRGSDAFGFFSAFAGEGSLQSGGSVRNHVVLADGAGRVLHSVSAGPFRDDGRFLEVEVPEGARFLTLAVGCAGDGNAMELRLQLGVCPRLLQTMDECLRLVGVQPLAECQRLVLHFPAALIDERRDR